jgi:NAD(P)-dependent dehydrogenase (short-subunit alcohol dehydrogenase family)
VGLFDGKVAIVTGAGRGIGREEALLLADEGAQVVVNDLGGGADGSGADRGPAQQVVEEILAAGGSAAANTDDISSWAGAAALVGLAVERFGGIDVVVNNAGILRGPHELHDVRGRPRVFDRRERSVETAVGTARGQEESGGAVEDLGWVHVKRSRG